MIYCYTHGLVPHSTLLSKVPSCRRQNTGRVPLDSAQRVRDFGALSPKLDVFIKTLASITDPCAREGRKIVKIRIH